MTDQERITALEARIAQLESRMAQQELPRTFGPIPQFPGSQQIPPFNFDLYRQHHIGDPVKVICATSGYIAETN